MKISVAHTTIYRYDSPVRLAPHVIRLRPRDDGSQKLACYELKITPEPRARSEALDQDGNVITLSWFGDAAAEFAVHSRFTVETFRENPFDFLLEQTVLPFEYPEPVRAFVAPYADAGAAPAVAEFARTAAEVAGWKTMDFLVELNQRIPRLLRPIARTEGKARKAAETLDAGEGACRDFAVLFCSACHAMGLAARFVSGYEREAARDPEHAYMHAWAEVYLPGGGWRGFDPTRGLAVSTAHVPIAAALDPDMAAPISGSYLGAKESTMETSIRMGTSE